LQRRKRGEALCFSALPSPPGHTAPPSCSGLTRPSTAAGAAWIRGPSPRVTKEREETRSKRKTRRPPKARPLRCATEFKKVRSATTDGEVRSWVRTSVGGHRVTKPTGRVRDSSLWIEYGPRDCGSCREAQIASDI